MINQIFYKDQSVSFYNEAGALVQITCEGEHIWRLRADAKEGASFSACGDAQGLCAYMGEAVNTIKLPLTVSENDAFCTVTAPNASTAKIAKTDAFSISFCNAEGERLSEITEIAFKDGKTTVCGTLLPQEGVFGGGQRFDFCNHRGNKIRLFSYDCYNTDFGKGTYLPIPLFYTTGGGGMFFNHYERMQVSFGDAEHDEWSLELCKDALDCYFYTAGDYQKLLQFYTDLTGTAVATPAEWMQGVLICRYSPEFASLEAIPWKFDRLEDIPNYQNYFLDWDCKIKTTDVPREEIINYPFLYASVGARVYIQNPNNGAFLRTSRKGGPNGAGIKPVVENLIAAGQKPTAMVLEGGFGVWRDCDDGGMRCAFPHRLYQWR